MEKATDIYAAPEKLSTQTLAQISVCSHSVLLLVWSYSVVSEGTIAGLCINWDYVFESKDLNQFKKEVRNKEQVVLAKIVCKWIVLECNPRDHEWGTRQSETGEEGKTNT